MAEKAVFYARAVVYYFDPKTKGWTPTAVGQNFCRVDMYENTGTNAFRVIGRGLQDTTKVVINSNVTKDTQYTRASETFHQWSDNRYIYGLNFVTKEEAEGFGTGFETTVTKLKEGSPSSTPQPQVTPPEVEKTGPPQAPQPPPQSKPEPKSEPQTGPPQAPQPPPQPKQNSGPPPPPQPPAVKEGGGDENRSSLLASISGFKGGLKKVQTVDKSSPIIKEEKSGGGSKPSPGGMMGDMLAQRAKMLSGKEPTSNNLPTKKSEAAHSPVKQPMNIPVKQPQQQVRSGSVSTGTGNAPSSMNQRENSQPPKNEVHHPSSSGNGITNPDLIAMKEEILAEMRKEIQAMKEEILAAIHNR